MKLPSFLFVAVLVVMIGCGKSKPESTQTSEAPTVEDSKPASDEPMFERPQSTSSGKTADAGAASGLEEFDVSPHREQELLNQLTASPKDTDVMLKLARLIQAKATDVKPPYPEYKRAASYLHQAINANPSIKQDTAFVEAAPDILFDEARALSRENDVARAIQSLNLAIELNPEIVYRVDREADLKNVRDSKEFAAIEPDFRKKIRALDEAYADKILKKRPKFTLEFELNDCDTEPIATKDYAGKILLVNVWGTWCGPCREEIPDLVACYEKFRSQGFEVIGLNSEYEQGDVANLLIKKTKRQLGIPYPCALLNDATSRQIPSMSVVPTSIFLDRRGYVRARIDGAVTQSKLEVIVQRLLQDPWTQLKPSSTKE